MMELCDLGRQEGDVRLLALSGHLNQQAVQEVEMTLRAAILSALSSGAPGLVIDLKGVDYVSSFGIGLFLEALREGEARKCRVVFAAPQKMVAEVMAACGIERNAGWEDTRDQALVIAAQSRPTEAPPTEGIEG